MGYIDLSQHINFREVIPQLLPDGMVRGEWYDTICPGHDDKKPSLSVNLNTGGYICRAGCGKGDYVKLFGIIKGISDRKAAFKQVCREFGIPPSNGSNGNRNTSGQGARSKEPLVPGPAPVNVDELVIPEEVWEKTLKLPAADQAWYKSERGWTAEAIDKLDVRLQTLYRDKKTGEIRNAYKKERVAIPVRDSKGRLRNIRLYHPKPGPKDVKIFSWGNSYGHARNFPAAPLDASPEVPVYLCEGEPDTICAVSMGLNAITHTGKPDTYDAELLGPFQNRDVIICYDADDPGQTYGRKAAKELYGKARSVSLLQWPDFMGKLPGGGWPKKGGQDLTDFFVKHRQTVADFNALPRVEFTAADKEAFEAEEAAKKPKGKGDLPEKERQAETLIGIGKSAELFPATDGTLWARFPVDGHSECWPIQGRGSGFRKWLVSEYFKKEGKAPAPTALQASIETLAAEAQFGEDRGAPREIYTRIAAHKGDIYLDMADEKWRTVKITAGGWSIIETPPVYFRRTHGMLPLPEPKPGGSLNPLDELINLGDKQTKILLICWLTFCLNPDGPYPLLVLISEQGSGKSTTAKILRMLADPNQAPTRSLPGNLEDLAITARNSWVLAFDNLSYLSDSFSDALCRMATGGGFATRKLYSNDEEAIFNAKRPVMVNGVSDIYSRPDLLERSLLVHLPTILPEKRLTEKVLGERFEKAGPELLGGLLAAVVNILKKLPEVSLKKHTRMADFSLWCAAAAAAGVVEGTPEEVVDLLFEKQGEALLSELDNPLAQAVLRLLESRGGRYEGQLVELHSKLNDIAPDESTIRQKSWPQTPRGLRSSLARLGPVLRVVGVRVSDLGRSNKGRQILIESDGCRDGSDGRVSQPSRLPSQTNNLKPLGFQDSRDGCDGCDDVFLTSTFQEDVEINKKIKDGNYTINMRVEEEIIETGKTPSQPSQPSRDLLNHSVLNDKNVFEKVTVGDGCDGPVTVEPPLNQPQAGDEGEFFCDLFSGEL